MVTMVAFRIPYVGMAILAGAFIICSIFEVRYQKKVKAEKAD
jgi:hypothetical protein